MMDVNVVRRGMLFGDVIPEVALAWLPVDAEVAMFDLALDPVDNFENVEPRTHEKNIAEAHEPTATTKTRYFCQKSPKQDRN